MKLQVPLLLWGMALPCLPCFLRAPPCYPSPQVGGSTDGCVPQSTHVPFPFPLSPFWVPEEAPVLLHSCHGDAWPRRGLLWGQTAAKAEGSELSSVLV